MAKSLGTSFYCSYQSSNFVRTYFVPLTAWQVVFQIPRESLFVAVTVCDHLMNDFICTHIGRNKIAIIQNKTLPTKQQTRCVVYGGCRNIDIVCTRAVVITSIVSGIEENSIYMNM